jgi:hypothetical protein
VGSGSGGDGWAVVGGDSVGCAALGGGGTSVFESKWTWVRRGRLHAFRYSANL